MEAMDMELAPMPGVIATLWAEGEEAAAAETPAAGAGDGTQPADGQETDPLEGIDPDNPDKGQEEPKADGRKNPDAIRKHLAALKANPETAELGKEVTNRLGKVRGYEELYPTVREAREVKELLDSVGGRAAVTAAIESHATMQRVDSLLEAGDPSILKDIFQQAPEGMVKLCGPILDEVQKVNPQAYQSLIKPHAVAMLNKDGMPGALNALADAFNKDDKAGMQDIIGRLLDYYRGLMQGAKPAAKDPDRERFEQEKSEFEKQKQTATYTEAFNANLAHSGEKIDAELAADIKRLGLNQKQVSKLRQEVWREIEKRRIGDKVFTSTLESRFKSKEGKAAAIKHMNEYTDRNVKDAVDEVVTTIYGDRKPAAKTNGKPDPTAPIKTGASGGAAKGAPVAAGWTRVANPPANHEIDREHKDTDVFGGKAVLKSGKRVQWR